MARIFSDGILNNAKLPSEAKEICKLLETNLSDEWICDVFLSDKDNMRIFVCGPDLGVLGLSIISCSADQASTLITEIAQYLDEYRNVIKKELQQSRQLCDDDGSLKFPVGYGMIFKEIAREDLSKDAIDHTTLDMISECTILRDELDHDLEDHLFALMEDFEFEELDEEELDILQNFFVNNKLDDICKILPESVLDEPQLSEDEIKIHDDINEKPKQEQYTEEDQFSYICNCIFENSPDDNAILAASFYNIANDFRKNNEFIMALRLYRKSLEFINNDPSIYSNLASCYKYLGYNDTAINLYLTCLKIDPDYKIVFLRLAFIYALKDDDDQAIICFQKFVDSAFYDRATIIFQIEKEIMSGDYSIGAIELLNIIRKYFQS